MKLAELEPHWVAEYGAPDDAKQGVSFLCPNCRARRLAIFFDVPICGRQPVDLKEVHRQAVDDGEAPGHLADHHIGSVLWHRAGATFDDLTLTPSIDASKFGCWHGFITNGEIR